MTTEDAAKRYLGEHMAQWGDRGFAVFNPHSKPVEELPMIWGFNNGGSRGWMSGCLIAQDGTGLGGHICSSECYMPHDLGVLEGSRPDRHEGFQKHYPDGYRMDFVGYSDVPANQGLMEAIRLNAITEDPADGD